MDAFVNGNAGLRIDKRMGCGGKEDQDPDPNHDVDSEQARSRIKYAILGFAPEPLDRHDK